MKTRDHFVYRVFDRYGVLLYIGVSCNPAKRREQHRYSARWFEFMHRCQLSGPYPKDVAYRVEAERIRTELPIFNLNADIDDWKQRRSSRVSELVRALGIDRIDEIGRMVDAEFPKQDLSWRMDFYLNTRRRRAVRSA